MATATSRISFDIPPLVNPHPRHTELAPTNLPPARRVSSESQTSGRASPSPRITRRTPVPFLLEAFPAPPSHIPGTPSSLSPSSLLGPSLLASTVGLLSSTSGGATVPTNPLPLVNGDVVSPCSPKVVATPLPSCNPPPSSPPTGPLPPIPGPSSVPPDVVATHRHLQTVARSASPTISLSGSHRSQYRTEHRPRLSIDSNDPVRGRRRQGSLSSLRKPIYPIGERKEAIAEERIETHSHCAPPAAVSQSPSVAERSHDLSRGDSPDILRSCLTREAAPAVGAVDKPYTEDSIASVDMSDLNTVKSDNEGDGDDQASRPFPRCPPLPHSQPQSPTDPPCTGPHFGHQPRKPSRSLIHVSSTPNNVTSRVRAKSPEITQIISATPRPLKRSTPSQSRERSRTRNRIDSSKSRQRADALPVPSTQTVKTPRAARLSGDDKVTSVRKVEEGNDSDSSLDLHTPLPQLMLRHGMLSPNSKLLPQLEADTTRLSIMSDLSSSSRISNMSNVSLKSMASTSSKHPKDARDTFQRRVRHRDGRLLQGGIGLTTGLGWSDSEDEDAPSPLTRRVSTLVLSRRASSSSVGSLRSSHSHSTSPHPLSRSISHSVLREADEPDAVPDVDEFGCSNRSSVATRSLPSRSNPVSRVGSLRSMGSSLGRYSTYSNSSANGIRARAGSVSESSMYADGTDGYGGLMPGIREQDDGVTPTRTAFERSSLGSLNGSAVAESPSSTASSASLPFPATPESGEDIHHLHPVYNQDKVLPPLPLSVRSNYPRTFSNASSVSTGSRIGVPTGNLKPNTVSAATTPRPSLSDRPPKSSIPAGTRRPSLNGTPRPSLTIPKSPLPAASGLPRPTTPSLSPHPNGGQGYTHRPLKLINCGAPSPIPTSPAELNQSPVKSLQPGEQLPRPGQILTYNRNVHDQLKLRTVSLTGHNRGPTPAVSPGGTQTLFRPSSAAGSASPSSALSSPATTRSHSPLPSSSPGADCFRPRPRIGTGMMYRTNLSVAPPPASRIRVPSTVSR
ncbi:hypothetical protein JVU11DRAFT_6089 [Chiua virens]|nr:hypothetical protein JVU11DRAFT_6089 [Chiua virens]